MGSPEGPAKQKSTTVTQDENDDDGCDDDDKIFATLPWHLDSLISPPFTFVRP